MQRPHAHFETERVARLALTLAGIESPDRQREVVSELFERLDRTRGLARRDYWLRQAFDLIGHHAGSVRILAEALADYHTRTWWRHSCLRTPPAYSQPLRVAFFEICRACDEAGCALPGERHRPAPRPADREFARAWAQLIG